MKAALSLSSTRSERALRFIVRAVLSVALLLGTLIQTVALSPFSTLEHKVAACTAILRVSVSEVAAPKTKSRLDAAVCKAIVLEVLKGPEDLTVVEFRFHANGSFSLDKLPQMFGKEYFIFLHEPPLPGAPPNQRWVFGGPAGIRPIAEEYQEYRFVDGKVITETHSHSNFVASIRAFANNNAPRKKEKEVEEAGQNTRCANDKGPFERYDSTESNDERIGVR